MRRSASAPCARRSSGATTCSIPAPGSSSPASRSSRAALPLEAAEEVCDADLDGLAALVDYSLVKPVGDDRFLMLETIREYARERLAGAEASDELSRRHAAYFAAVAEQAYAHRFDAEAEWSARLDSDHDDLRAALDWLGANDVDAALELAGALGWFWLSRGLLEEGCRRLSEALSASGSGGRSRARALTAAGALDGPTWRRRDGSSAARGGARAVARARRPGRARLGPRLARLASHLRRRRRGRRAGGIRGGARDPPRARRRQPGRLARSSASPRCSSHWARSSGPRRSHASCSRGQRGDPRTEHFAYHFLADCALIRGDTVEAEERYRQSLRAALPLGDVIETSFEVQGVAMAVAGNGDPERALRLAGSVEALWESLGISISIAFWDALLDRYLEPGARAARRGGRRRVGGGPRARVRRGGRARTFRDFLAAVANSISARRCDSTASRCGS